MIILTVGDIIFMNIDWDVKPFIYDISRKLESEAVKILHANAQQDFLLGMHSGTYRTMKNVTVHLIFWYVRDSMRKFTGLLSLDIRIAPAGI